MIPGLGGMNPKKMAGMMKQLGINQEEIEADRVVIERVDGNIIIENPSVAKITLQGKVSWQIVGDVSESAESFSEADVELVAEKTGRSAEEARAALEESNGEVAEAILKLRG